MLVQSRTEGGVTVDGEMWFVDVGWRADVHIDVGMLNEPEQRNHTIIK